MSQRRGELLGQIVVYVLGLLVISLVFVFGYGVIKDFGEKRCQVQRTTFSTQFSTQLDRNLAWGTNKVIRLDAPCGTQQICLIDREAADNEETLMWENPPSGQPARDAIQSAVASGQGANVFTIDSDGDTFVFERDSDKGLPIAISQVDDPSKNAQCFDVGGGSFDARLQGTGSLVKVSSP